MALAVLLFLNAFLSVKANPHIEPCVDKAAGDPCEYGSSSAKGVCCTTILDDYGMHTRFCKNCEMPGAKTQGECTLRVTDKYLGCFRRAEDSLIFQTCHGVALGGRCMYETSRSRRLGTPAFNTTGACFQHFYHQGVMCLDAIGDEDDDECYAKAVGQPCNHSELPRAICTHHPRKGTWMCSAPQTAAPVHAVCEGMEKGTPCSYTAKIDERFDNGKDSGLIQGACDLYDEAHADLMCLATSTPNDENEDEGKDEGEDEDEEKEEEGFPTIILIIAITVSLFVGSITGFSLGCIMQRHSQHKKLPTALRPKATAGMVSEAIGNVKETDSENFVNVDLRLSKP